MIPASLISDLQTLVSHRSSFFVHDSPAASTYQGVAAGAENSLATVLVLSGSNTYRCFIDNHAAETSDPMR